MKRVVKVMMAAAVIGGATMIMAGLVVCNGWLIIGGFALMTGMSIPFVAVMEKMDNI